MSEQKQNQVAVQSSVQSSIPTLNFFGNEEEQAKIWNTCGMIAKSNIAPPSYKQPENVYVAMMQVQELKNTNLFEFMRGTYFLHGQIGYTSKYLISLAMKSGLFENRPRWELERNTEGQILSCTCFIHLKGDEKPVEFKLTWNTVVAEGWHLSKGKEGAKKESKWITMTEKMFMYRSFAWGCDLYCPEITAGIKEADDIEDSHREIDLEVVENDQLPQIAPIDLLAPKEEKKKEEKPVEVVETVEEVKTEVKTEDKFAPNYPTPKTVPEEIKEECPLPEENAPLPVEEAPEAVYSEPMPEEPKKKEYVKLKDQYTPEQFQEMKISVIQKISELGETPLFTEWLVSLKKLKDGENLKKLNNTNVVRIFTGWEKVIKKYNVWKEEKVNKELEQ